MRISTIKEQFQKNAGPQINARRFKSRKYGIRSQKGVLDHSFTIFCLCGVLCIWHVCAVHLTQENRLSCAFLNCIVNPLWIITMRKQVCMTKLKESRAKLFILPVNCSTCGSSPWTLDLCKGRMIKNVIRNPLHVLKVFSCDVRENKVKLRLWFVWASAKWFKSGPGLFTRDLSALVPKWASVRPRLFKFWTRANREKFGTGPL